MTNNNKNLGELLAVDMPNGYTYIGFGQDHHRPLMLKKAIFVRTDKTMYAKSFTKGEPSSLFTKDAYIAKEYYEKSVEKKEKEIRIDNPGPIHYLD